MSQPHQSGRSRWSVSGLARIPRIGKRRSRRIRGRRPRGTPPTLLLRRFAAVALMITATLLLIRPTAEHDAADAATTEVTVIVAARDLQAGVPIQADMLAQTTVPTGLAPQGADLSASELIGAHPLGAVRAGEVITDARVTELALDDGPARALPPGLVPVVIHITDPAVISTLAPGMCLDLYAGEPGAPLDVVATGLYLAAILDNPPDGSNTAATGRDGGSTSQNVRFLVLGAPTDGISGVASSTSSSILFATVCAEIANQSPQ